MQYTENFSEVVDPIGSVYPQTVTDGSEDTGYVSMGDYNRMAAVLYVGANATSAQLQLFQAQDDAGTGEKLVTGKDTTALAGADQKAVIELRNDELDVNNGFTFVAARVTTVGAAAVQVALYGTAPRQAPVPVANWGTIID